MPADRTRCGVLGSPISHSLSPTLHRAAYAALGLDWVYDAHEVDETGLAAFLAGLGPEWRGLSLTMPLKQAAVGLCARVSDDARLVNAVNTVLVEAGELVGVNTDVPGFVAAWSEAGIVGVRRAAVLGAGATARSAVAALRLVGAVEVIVLAREPARASSVVALAQVQGLEVDVRRLDEAAGVGALDLLISTIPASAQTAALTSDLVAQALAVCDVVYSPRETPILQAGRRAGVPCAEGFDLLLQQAGLQVSLMTGAPAAPIGAMRAAGLAELARR